MDLNYSHYQQIEDCFPRQRGNVSLDNLSVLNAILYVAENEVQVAQPACGLRSLAYDLYAYEPLGKGRSS